jgi:enterochelin esterase family protein
MNTRVKMPWILVATSLALAPPPATRAQAPGQRPQPVVSPEVKAGGEVVFRLRAPGAGAVRLDGGDMPGLGGENGKLTRGEDGVWSLTKSGVPAGAYRYVFNVDGIRTADPGNPATSESNDTVWSLVVVPGSEWFDTKDVPHGALAEVTYASKTLGRARRMHVYTPPGYEKGTDAYPVFYLLHGASDSDDSWSSVGRASTILDNLIAAGKARPMVVVMPHGHTRRSGIPAAAGTPDRARQTSEFTEEFATDIRPSIESHYRVKTDRASRAIAGLSMGGGQTLEIVAKDLGSYGAFGVFSSGVFGIDRSPNGSPWETTHAAALDDTALRSGLKLVWFATGKDDFLLETSRKTVEMLKKHGLDVKYEETGGGHTWLNWRDYLVTFAPQLFP